MALERKPGKAIEITGRECHFKYPRGPGDRMNKAESYEAGRSCRQEIMVRIERLILGASEVEYHTDSILFYSLFTIYRESLFIYTFDIGLAVVVLNGSFP